MQSIKLLFLALLLAHILGSLLFQTNRDSSRQSAKVYAKDGLFYFLAMLACLFLALDRLPWIKTILWLAAFTAIHLTLDHSRRFIYKIKGSLNGALSHVIDQFLHLAALWRCQRFWAMHPGARLLIRSGSPVTKRRNYSSSPYFMRAPYLPVDI